MVDGGLGRREDGTLGRFLALGGHRDRDASGVPGPTLFDLHQTHTVAIDGPLARSEVEALVAGLPSRFPGRTIARAKGVIDLADGDRNELSGERGQMLIQVVGSRSELTPMFESERQRATDLVVITVDAD